MKRQKSILSFLQRPSPVPENEKPVGGGAPKAVVSEEKLQHNRNVITASNQYQPAVVFSSTVVGISDEVRGTDTPPEKEQRPFFPSKSIAGGGGGNGEPNRNGHAMFSSIMHKFVKPNSAEKPKIHEVYVCIFLLVCRNLLGGSNDVIYSSSSKSSHSNGRDKEGGSVSGSSTMKNVFDVEKMDCQGDKRYPLLVESDEDIIGPETPGTRPLVPRLKRVLEDGCNFASTTTTQPSMDNSKRTKFSDDLLAEKKKDEVASEMASKFDWLHPSRIKDANGRRPDNPLFDKRTLYIPRDVLMNMSASQKQYWSVKSQYMDVLIFFKVGKFYELYELDAEIGHKELDWKLTMSGVGKCRQVGISEVAIDDAIEKLLARGYKVGRVEQLETSAQAKSRGATAVIQRKLVNVLTPSTLIHGNIGPQAVHLLALKEGIRNSDDGSIAYGFAFVDCAAIQFWVGSISDDASYAALGALLMQVSPGEVIFESQGLSKEAQKALNKYSLMGSVASQLTPAQPATDFVDSSEVRHVIQMKGYFKGSFNAWDRALDGVVHQDLALCALGGLTSHLSRLKLDDVLRNGSIRPYEVYKGCLRMDGQTMANLEIFSNSVDGGISGKNNCSSGRYAHVKHVI
ncbi:hypothetical protein OSB04_015184 [Centaurea solstitialis]|uniref:DNA mismatch repair protein MSH7 n=1 Tax=Centaurea solstitialis TaxID=347529 RepID=A0AA38T048_9ASTR|nr:hypothetical protein OSB04_015184 [Centaurea solstitialis]